MAPTEATSFLRPKLYFLREIRVQFNGNAYVNSQLMRYLEEALAETVAQVGVNGFRAAVDGIKFPVKNGKVYAISLAGMRTEAVGILLRPVNVGGMIFNVYFSLGADKPR